MIFITLGSQKFQFNRLLEWIDDLIKENVIQEDVFAQVGYSDYIPESYEYSDFLVRNEYLNKIQDANIVITHAGTGAIVSALKNEKSIIAVPRDVTYNEHVDNHQNQIVENFVEKNLIFGASTKKELKCRIRDISEWEFSTFQSENNRYIETLKKYIDNI